MTPTALRVATLAIVTALAVPAQDWTDDELVANCPGFQSESLLVRLDQVGKLLAAQEKAFSAPPFRPEEWRNLGLAIGAPGRQSGQRHCPTDSRK
jgi:hypothetical protein